MIAPGEQAVWDFGQAVVLVDFAADGLSLDVTMLDRGWEGEKRQERCCITLQADGWHAEPPVEGRQSAPSWEELLPAICHLTDPTDVTRSGGAASAGF